MVEFLIGVEEMGISTWVREGGALYGYPLILFTHTLCLSIVVGGALAISLRLLGLASTLPLQPLEKLYPVMWPAFFLNAFTGLLLLMADATYKLANPTFYVKMVFVAGGVVVLRLMQKKVFAKPDIDTAPIPPNLKVMAMLSIACWLGALTAGRLLAYLGPVAGLADDYY